jgi:hypothetical protein
VRSPPALWRVFPARTETNDIERHLPDLAPAGCASTNPDLPEHFPSQGKGPNRTRKLSLQVSLREEQWQDSEFLFQKHHRVGECDAKATEKDVRTHLSRNLGAKIFTF